tara:strand:+ start:1058 stop:1564 length:507 start_codon:yes stop_codon:yes gene_type:complete
MFKGILYIYKLFLLNLFLLAICSGQTDLSEITKKQTINTGGRYVSGPDGVIRMYVNVWGDVASPGRILVDESIDLAILLSLIGGPKKGANLKKIRVYHEYPDEEGKYIHIINLTDFIQTGDRSKFIKIQPNDTFIVQQTAWSYFLQEISTVNTLMGLVNIYLNLKDFY